MFQLENGYTFHDYNIKLNDVIQLMVKAQPEDSPKENRKAEEKTNEDSNKTLDDKEKDYKGLYLYNILCILNTVFVMQSSNVINFTEQSTVTDCNT